MNPETIGAITPASCPAVFCMPVHLPAAAGPARVCVIAQWFDAYIPNATYATLRSATQRLRSETIAAGTMMVESRSPPATKVFRTRVGVPPRLIHVSEAHPQ